MKAHIIVRRVIAGIVAALLLFGQQARSQSPRFDRMPASVINSRPLI